MDFEKILSALLKGEISNAEAEKQRMNLLQQSPTKKRGRPKKNAVAQQKHSHSGRPKSLDAFYKEAAVNGLWIVLNYVAKEMPQIQKRDFIAKKLNTTRSTVDKAIAKLTQRIAANKTIYIFNSHDGVLSILNGTECTQFVSQSFLEKRAKINNRLKIK